MNHLAGTYLATNRWAEAEVTARECLSHFEKKQPDEWLRFHAMSQLGAALAGQKRAFGGRVGATPRLRRAEDPRGHDPFSIQGKIVGSLCPDRRALSRLG